MIILDTNVIIYAFDENSPYNDWARNLIITQSAKKQAVINTIILAELCVGDSTPATLAIRLRSWGINLIDLPTVAASVCASSFNNYLKKRKATGNLNVPKIPLPDFFIGAHAEIMDWQIATADIGRYKTYFPKVKLITPF